MPKVSTAILASLLRIKLFMLLTIYVSVDKISYFLLIKLLSASFNIYKI